METDPALALANSIVVSVFVGTWITLGVFTYFAFFRNKNAAFKRAWLPPYAILIGVLFVVFSTTATVLESPRWSTLIGVLAIELPAVSIITHLNIRFTKVCETCGATQVDMWWLLGGSKACCSACGAPLKHEPTTPLKHKPTGTDGDLE